MEACTGKKSNEGRQMEYMCMNEWGGQQNGEDAISAGSILKVCK